MSQIRFLTHRKSVGDRLLRVLRTSLVTAQLEFFNLICECEAILGVGDRDRIACLPVFGHAIEMSAA
ncbi:MULTISPECIES: hypothetical protein [unclassified Microcoleus]|uniref:hypothetical protein n=1 Tax=unclassified Microcoleus TaxID=2642155 RepID=UPI0025E5CAAA|nr:MULTISPECIES: hypothetical protein [unclassified Microcoleus]